MVDEPYVHFDAASGQPLHPAARTALLAALEQGWADPARLYGPARRARMLLDAARASVARAVGARPDEVTFCASGTQAAHLAVLGTLQGRRRTGRHLVVSAVEHSCVLEAARRHEADGGEVTVVPVDAYGRVAAVDVAAALRPDTALVSVQAANPEVGTAQPVAEIAAACTERGVPLHVDAAAAVGWAPVPDGWAVLTASAHKWGGPAGVGVLVVRPAARWRPPGPVDEREHGRVAGRENVPAVVAAATALEAVLADPAEPSRVHALVDRIRGTVAATVPDVEVVGDPDRRLPHVVTFSCLYVDGEQLVTALDRAGFAVTSGSACTASALRPSHVLAAMGTLTHGNVRVSLPHGAREADVERFLDVLPGVVERLRAEAGTGAL